MSLLQHCCRKTAGEADNPCVAAAGAVGDGVAAAVTLVAFDVGDDGGAAARPLLGWRDHTHRQVSLAGCLPAVVDVLVVEPVADVVAAYVEVVEEADFVAQALIELITLTNPELQNCFSDFPTAENLRPLLCLPL